jgi:hypothetical protein
MNFLDNSPGDGSGFQAAYYDHEDLPIKETQHYHSTHID